ncbi:MAG: oligoendopeptidase F, partial [Deltaproteobacteria bacterium]|nr:oligoendopeptidase F [Deltaproteobacteria bacterium]
YQIYRQDGKPFIPKYLDLLKAGGSIAPPELVKPLGVDLEDPAFWAQGYKLVQDMLDELKQLV